MSGDAPTGPVVLAIDVEVVLATPASQQVVALTVPVGCTAREAVRRALAAGLDPTRAPEVDPERGPLGVFGERVADGRVLLAADRVELYRPLRQDPRERRRRRAAEARRASGDGSSRTRWTGPTGRGG